MDLLYQWFGSILCFLIFITMASALLPSKKYEKYIRFFAGMVLVLIVVQPLTGSLRLEDRIAYYFEAISFQKESRDLSRQILGIEEERLTRVIAEYEHAVEQDVENMAADMGFLTESVDVTIESDQEKENYGKVIHVFMQVVWDVEDGGETSAGRGNEAVTGEEGGQRDGTAEEGFQAETGSMNIVDEISIETVEIEKIKAGGGRQDGSSAGQPSDSAGQPLDSVGQPLDPAGLEASSRNTEAAESLRKLRRKVERYYGLESKEVEIELKVR